MYPENEGIGSEMAGEERVALTRLRDVQTNKNDVMIFHGSSSSDELQQVNTAFSELSFADR